MINIYLTLILYTSINISNITNVNLNKSINDSADTAFNNLEKILDNTFIHTNLLSEFLQKKDTSLIINEKEKIDSICLSYRSIGRTLWVKFQNDPRRFDWLLGTLEFSDDFLQYWKYPRKAFKAQLNKPAFHATYNAEINKESIIEWETSLADMKKEFFKYFSNDKSSNSSYKLARFMTGELSYFLEKNRNIEILSKKELLSKIKESFDSLSVLEKFPNSKSMTEAWFRECNYRFFSGYKYYGFTPSEILEFLTQLKSFHQSPKNIWINQVRKLFDLANNPFHLTISSTNNESLDINLICNNNKAVLLDFWTINCAPCIRRMHYFKEIHNKYKNQGFQVISIAMNKLEDSIKVLRIKENVGFDWPIAILGSPLDSNTMAYKIATTYGFRGYSQLILLDNEGKMILYGNELLEGSFEDLLKNALNINSK